MNASDFKKLLADNIQLGYKHSTIVDRMYALSPGELNTFIVYEGYGEEVIREIVDLWSNDYETVLGGGYYPFPYKNDPGNTRKSHVFEKENLIWRQVTGETIKGLDDEYGEHLLKLLNGNVHHCTQLRNIRDIVLFPKLDNSTFS
jgi:hypothetical protein